MSTPEYRIRCLQKELAAIQSGEVKPRRGPRGPAASYYHDVPDYSPGASRHAMLPMPFKLIERDHLNGLKYSALCPRCGVGVIVVSTVFRDGYAEWPPESGIPELCLECEDKLDAALEAKA